MDLDVETCNDGLNIAVGLLAPKGRHPLLGDYNLTVVYVHNRTGRRRVLSRPGRTWAILSGHNLRLAFE